MKIVKKLKQLGTIIIFERLLVTIYINTDLSKNGF